MKMKKYLLAFSCGAALLAASPLRAVDAKTYQVTGPVLALTPSTITVQKGDDKWEIARDSTTKVPSDIKVGDKVTIYYKMVAAEVEVKDAKGKKEAKKEGKK
jgi:LysM repeat protein